MNVVLLDNILELSIGCALSGGGFRVLGIFLGFGWAEDAGGFPPGAGMTGPWWKCAVLGDCHGRLRALAMSDIRLGDCHGRLGALAMSDIRLGDCHGRLRALAMSDSGQGDCRVACGDSQCSAGWERRGG
jgi:hypothetical protein